jgi:hypothetical protein
MTPTMTESGDERGNEKPTESESGYSVRRSEFDRSGNRLSVRESSFANRSPVLVRNVVRLASSRAVTGAPKTIGAEDAKICACPVEPLVIAEGGTGSVGDQTNHQVLGNPFLSG